MGQKHRNTHLGTKAGCQKNMKAKITTYDTKTEYVNSKEIVVDFPLYFKFGNLEDDFTEEYWKVKISKNVYVGILPDARHYLEISKVFKYQDGGFVKYKIYKSFRYSNQISKSEINFVTTKAIWDRVTKEIKVLL
jgi:hypothetical protein